MLAVHWFTSGEYLSGYCWSVFGVGAGRVWVGPTRRKQAGLNANEDEQQMKNANSKPAGGPGGSTRRRGNSLRVFHLLFAFHLRYNFVADISACASA
jgi:hypothetical protein